MIGRRTTPGRHALPAIEHTRQKEKKKRNRFERRRREKRGREKEEGGTETRSGGEKKRKQKKKEREKKEEGECVCKDVCIWRIESSSFTCQPSDQTRKKYLCFLAFSHCITSSPRTSDKTLWRERSVFQKNTKRGN